MVRSDLEFDSDQESGSEIASMQKPGRQRSVTLLGSRISLGLFRNGPIVKAWFAQVPSQTESAEGLLVTICRK